MSEEKKLNLTSDKEEKHIPVNENKSNHDLPQEIRKDLETEFLGKNIHFCKEVDSTNNMAKKLANEGAEDGTVVIADQQFRGRGRRGKKWISPAGGLWMTIILRPNVEPAKVPQLTLVTGVAVAETLAEEYNLDIGIKWPNDILIGDKKVSGILTELKTVNGKVDYAIVGIGIDMNLDISSFPPELRGDATSIKTELDHEIERTELIQKLLVRFEALYNQFKEGNFREILTRWRKMSSTIGKYVKVYKKSRTVYGEAVGVNKDGKLILEEDDGSLRKIISGECIHLTK